MVWQQWVLVIWYVFRIPFGISREITKDQSKIPESKRDQARTIGIVAYLIVTMTIITLIVTI